MKPPNKIMFKGCRTAAILHAVLIIAAANFTSAFASDIVDKNFGIGLQVRLTTQSGVVSITWQVSSSTLAKGANDFELQYYVGTDINNSDSDGDGFNDGVEIRNGSDPKNPGSVPHNNPASWLPLLLDEL